MATVRRGQYCVSKLNHNIAEKMSDSDFHPRIDPNARCTSRLGSPINDHLRLMQCGIEMKLRRARNGCSSVVVSPLPRLALILTSGIGARSSSAVCAHGFCLTHAPQFGALWWKCGVAGIQEMARMQPLAKRVSVLSVQSEILE